MAHWVISLSLTALVGLLVWLIANRSQNDERGGLPPPSSPGVDSSDGLEPRIKALARTTDGQVILISAEDGRELKTLRTRASGAWLAVTPDGSTAYMSIEGTDCGEMFKMDPATGALTNLGIDGLWPQPSQDGRQLAYAEVKTGARGDCYHPVALVVSDLVSGVEKRWEYQASEPGGLFAESWAPDGRHLIFSRGGEAPSGPYLLDTSRKGRLLDVAERMTSRTEGERWGEPHYVAIGLVSSAASCNVHQIDPPPGSVCRSLLVLIGEGGERKVLMEFPPDEGGNVRVDPSGRYVMWQAWPSPTKSTLRRSRIDGQGIVTLAKGIEVAYWLGPAPADL